MQEMAPRFSKFSGGHAHGPPSKLPGFARSLGRSLAALGRAPRIITLQSIFETWQAWHLYMQFRFNEKMSSNART